MGAFQIDLPDALLQEAQKLASKDGVTLEKYLQSLISRHVASIKRIQCFMDNPEDAPSRERVLEILDKAPNVPPVPGDELPE